MSLLNRNTDLGILVMRLAVGGLMLLHGIAKLNGIDGIAGMLKAKGLPEFIAYGVYIGEILAPLMLIAGYRVRIAAVIFIGNVLTAMYLAHSHEIYAMKERGGWAVELLGLYLFGAVALFFTGGGKIAISSSSRWD